MPNSSNQLILKLFSIGLLLGRIGISTGCSHLYPHSWPTLETSELKKQLLKAGTQSRIEIEYILEKDHYRFHAESLGNSVKATAFINRQVLEQGDINPDRYPEFFAQASRLVLNKTHSEASQTQQQAPPASLCRTPYSITIQFHDHKESIRGCRSLDDGTFSKLVRDGEFLLYSKI